ncbi:hypothetical protein AKJ66_00055 [candidate division MSBL1 archaeon SCGC-AAA259E22]|uniref:Uncharacterized protein n=1 Tax=candidate division MSBL1 archaeon SCGC-AAA259E22 TaxID=1698265 RepID=A0A133UIF6_9EURY|nr:hypothetical protein AKJ66_00055 [candidate division MSBL1 archaeon SCGC-AAA259E22]
MKRKRKFGLVYFVFGLVVSLIGFEMWKRPHLDWGTFVKDMGSLAGQIGSGAFHLARDPFAALGIAVVFGGLVLVYEGLKKSLTPA